MKHLTAELRSIFPDIRIVENEPLKNHTSFRIGGPAAAAAFPKNTEELSALLKGCKKYSVQFRILGAGTNILICDEGIPELVICTKDALTGLSVSGTTVTAMAGQSLCKTANYARDLGLSGMECLHGIPGSVGGGVFMNAGAYDGDISSVCKKVTFMDYDGTMHDISEEMFSYRSSVFQTMQVVIVSACFELKPDDPKRISEKMQELMERRRAKQPLEYPSAGSTFKRPEGYFAGKLIEDAGLKGLRIGDAAVSEKHAGFVVNLGNAAASDVRALIAEVQKRVKDASGIVLEPEIKFW